MRKASPISSRNSAWQHLEVIRRNRTTRTKVGDVAVEGVIPIDLLVRSGRPITRIYFREGAELSAWARDLIESRPEATLYAVRPDLMAELSDKDSGSEVIVVADRPEHRADRIRLDRVLVVDRPASPGNLGTMVRTVNSFGLDAVLISGHGADPYDPKCIAASRGTVFRTPVVALGSHRELEAALAGLTVYGSSAKKGTPLEEVAPADRFALVLGNETTGMARQLRERADAMIRIPLAGDTSSLNVACAASILIYALAGRRRT